MKLKRELQINNTFQIAEDFSGGICPPRPWKQNNPPRFNQPGKVKVYTEEEIFLYQLKQMKPNTFYGN